MVYKGSFDYRRTACSGICSLALVAVTIGLQNRRFDRIIINPSANIVLVALAARLEKLKCIRPCPVLTTNSYCVLLELIDVCFAALNLTVVFKSLQLL